MPDETETRTFWLSFVGDEGFRGGCIVDVTTEDAARAAVFILLNFPHAKPDSEWMLAATNKAHRVGCNPGGEVAIVQIPLTVVPPGVTLIKNTLLSRAQLEALGYQPKVMSDDDDTIH